MTFIRTALLCSLFSILAAASAFADDSQDTVISKTTDVVVSSNGNCVRTKWQVDSDVCAPKKETVQAPPPPPPAPPPPKQEEISQDKRTVYFYFNKA